MKPKYTPVKRDAPSVEEHETVARKNKGKERTDCRHTQKAARGILQSSDKATRRQDALGRGAQAHADRIGPSGRWYSPREASAT